MSDREFLIEANIQDVLKYIIADFDLSITEAMRQFYVSEVFAKLQNQDTGLYLESPAYICIKMKWEMASWFKKSSNYGEAIIRLF